jgi:hypothetical protein
MTPAAGIAAAVDIDFLLRSWTAVSAFGQLLHQRWATAWCITLGHAQRSVQLLGNGGGQSSSGDKLADIGGKPIKITLGSQTGPALAS